VNEGKGVEKSGTRTITLYQERGGRDRKEKNVIGKKSWPWPQKGGHTLRGGPLITVGKVTTYTSSGTRASPAKKKKKTPQKHKERV